MSNRGVCAPRGLVRAMLGCSALVLGGALLVVGSGARAAQLPKAKPKGGMAAPKAKGGAPAPKGTAAPKGAAAPKAKGAGRFLSPAPGNWKVKPDPPATPPPAIADAINVRIPNNFFIEDDVIYPSGPSPFIAVGRESNREVYDLSTNARVGAIRNGKFEKPSALSPDGSLIAGKTGGFEKTVAVFETRVGRPVALIKVEGNVDFVDFVGPENKLLTGACNEHMFEVWNAETQQAEIEMPLRGNVYPASVCISPGRKYVAMVGTDSKGLWIYDATNGQRAGEIPIPKNNIFNLECRGLAFSPDGAELAGFFESFGLYIMCWDMATGRLIDQFKFDDKSGLKPPPFLKDHPGTIQWLPDKRAWLLNGNTVVDRNSGEKVFTVPSDTPGADKGTRHVLANGVLLIPAGPSGNRAVRGFKLPLETIANAAKIVQSGGNAADAALPPLKPADLSAAKRIPPGARATGWSAAPDPAPTGRSLINRPFALRCQGGEPQRILFAGPEAAVAAVVSLPGGFNTFEPAQNESKARRVDRHDLFSGRFLGRLELPPALEPLALSPEGGHVLATDGKERTRVDVYALEDQKPTVSWRPYEKDGGDGRTIIWAAFLDATRVLTCSRLGKVVLWTLPDCKAVYVADSACEGAPVLSPGRKQLALYAAGTVRLMDAATGSILGDAAAPQSAGGGRTDLSGAAFSPDGSSLVALVNGYQLVRWDLKTGRAVSDFRTPMVITPGSGGVNAPAPNPAANNPAGNALPPLGNTPVVECCGTQHALLDGRILMDLVRMAHVWSYFGTSSAAAGPDGRHWYTTGQATNQPAMLAAVALPDAAVNQAVAMVGNPAVKASLRVGTKVGLQLEFGGPPRDTQGFRNQVAELLNAKIRANGMTPGEGAPTSIVVHVDERDTGRKVVYSSRAFGMPRFAQPQNVTTLAITNLDCEVQLSDAQGRITLVPKQTFLTPSPFIMRLPQGESDIAAFLKSRHWDAVKNYLSGIGLPYFVSRQASGVVMVPGVTNLGTQQ